MLTDKQLTETALRMLDAYLADAPAALTDAVGEWLCRDHCPAECGHDAAESAKEMSAVSARIQDAVTDLRDRLATLAANEGIDLKGNA